MRPRFVINKGIKKKITAVSSRFLLGVTYEAAIYNAKDLSTKIIAQGLCTLNQTNLRPQVEFTFSATNTDKLKVGFATIEIYDTSKSSMIFRDEFATIRKNSLPITGSGGTSYEYVNSYTLPEDTSEVQIAAADDVNNCCMLLTSSETATVNISVFFQEVGDTTIDWDYASAVQLQQGELFELGTTLSDYVSADAHSHGVMYRSDHVTKIELYVNSGLESPANISIYRKVVG